VVASNHSGRWIGWRGPTMWPPRSPNVTPLDYFLWGRLKQHACAALRTTTNEIVLRLQVPLTTVHSNMLCSKDRSAVNCRLLEM
jgi:hypothetical protein